MKSTLLSLCLIYQFLSSASAQQLAPIRSSSDPESASDSRLPTYQRDVNPALDNPQPIIQLALLLDTSSSMGGLIRQAKTQLWSMVNAFVKVKKDGVHPQFQVALYEYGSNQLVDSRGYVRQAVPLTDNLDEVSQKLMALQASTRSGSEEQCGWALHQAVEQLGWSASADDLKVICIAGNESFAQGPIPYEIPCRMASDAAISINTIFCGSHAQGQQLDWETAAQRGGGSYSSIDHNIVRPPIAAPQDAELSALNAALNATYVPYTRSGFAAQRSQQIADADAQNLAQSSLSERAALKATQFYKTEDWDLVEAAQQDSFDLHAVPASTLPDHMQQMSMEQKRQHLADLAKRRDAIKKKIIAVSEARTRHLQSLGQDTTQPLDKAVIESLKAQARKKQFLDD